MKRFISSIFLWKSILGVTKNNISRWYCFTSFGCCNVVSFQKETAMGTNGLAPMAGMSLLSGPLVFLLLQWPPITFSLVLQPLRFRNLCLHLHDQHLQFLLTLFAGVCIDIAGVLFTVGSFGRVAAFKQMVVDLADTAGTGSALAAHVGLEIGHTRLFRLGRGSFLPRL